MKKLLPKTINNPQGFTLIELLVVIVIIAILSIIGISIFSGTQKNARDARRKADIESISRALEANYNAGSSTPYQLLPTMFAGGSLPTDPQGSSYTYTPSGIGTGSTGTTYTVCAALENANGNASTNTGTAATGAAAIFYCLKAQQ